MIRISQLDIKQVFSQIVNKEQPTYQLKSKFINILKKQSKYDTSLSRDEVNWMVQNIDAIENILSSERACAVIYCLFKYKECYIAQISRLVRSYTSPVKYWINSLKKVWLVESRGSQFRNDKVFYHLNKNIYPNIISCFVSMMVDRYGKQGLNNLITPDRKDGGVVDKQYSAITKTVNKTVKSSIFN